LGGVRRCWEVLGGVGRCWEVLGGVGRCWEVFGALVTLTMARYSELLPCLLCMRALTTASVWLAMSQGSVPDGAVTRPCISMRSRNGTSGLEM